MSIRDRGLQVHRGLLSLAFIFVLIFASGFSFKSGIGSSKSASSSRSNDLAILGLPPGPLHYFPSFDVRTTNSSTSMPWPQAEPSIAINPKKPSNMIVGYNDLSHMFVDNLVTPHWSYSTDGGATWTTGASPLPSTGLYYSLWSDTGVAFDSNGYAYLVTMTQPGYESNIVLYVSIPDNNGNSGATWNGPYIVTTACNTNGCGTDKPAILVDNTGGAHKGNIYVSWEEDFPSNGLEYQKVMLRTATLSGGIPTFSGSPVQASNPSDPFNWGPALTIAPDDSLYVAYLQLSSIFSNYKPKAVMISRSDDGGANFALRGQTLDSSITQLNLNEPNEEPSATHFPTIAATAAGTVFVAWTDYTANTKTNDIISRTSSDRGSNWSSRVQVNDRGTNDLSDRFLPAATFNDGKIYVFYYSRQADKNNVFGGPYMVTSTNDGAIFTKSVRLSSTFSNPSVCTNFSGHPCLWGDYMSAASLSHTTGLTTTNTVCAVWGDSRDSNSYHDNDVNVYIQCIVNSYFTTPARFWWRILRLPINLVAGPVPVPPPGCPSCTRVWTATILPSDSPQGTQVVNLTAVNIPSGVSVNISPASAVPPFNATITLNFARATCVGAPACLENIGINATDGVNSSSINMTEILTSAPYLITDTNIYNSGEIVNLTGLAFTASSTATIMLDGRRVSSSSIDSVGGFSLLVTLPSTLSRGDHTLQANDTNSKIASTTFRSPKLLVETPPRTLPITTLTPLALLLLVATMGTTAVIVRSWRRRSRLTQFR